MLDCVTSRRRQRGFTLIELLVVIAIIAIIAAILLPAVMYAREISYQAKCRNNLKQIALALHNYEATHLTFPIGARLQSVGIGPSWFVGILPHIDQQTLYDKFDHEGKNNGYPGIPLSPPLASRNGVQLNGVRVPTFWCSSSSLPEFSTPNPLGRTYQMTSYVGISGAGNLGDALATRITACCTVNSKNGQLSADGVLVPGAAIRMSEVQKDGSSHVLVVGESSAYLPSAAGKRSDGGWSLGWAAGTSGGGTPPLYGGPGNTAPNVNNLTTILHPPNSSFNQAGVGENVGPNNPLSSPHSGGCFAALVDGSVHFLSSSIDLTVLRRAAVRDDGIIIPDF